MKTQKLTIVLSVVLVLAIIFAVYEIVQNQSLNSQITQQAEQNLNISLTNADRFDTQLHDLLQEHTFLLIDTLRRSTGTNVAAYNASLIALQNNINEVGTLLIPIYGTNAQQLVNLWNQKTNILINYSISVKSGDPTASSTFASAASAYEVSCATFWSTNTNPYPQFDYNTMLQVVTTHVTDMKKALDDWNAGNYPTYFVDLEIAYNQMGVYADTIAQGIISQHPEDFR